MPNLSAIRKSLVGAAIAFLGALQVGLPGGLDVQEVIGALIAGLVALGAVYGVTNSAPPVSD